MTKQEMISDLKEILIEASNLPYTKEWEKFDYLYKQIDLLLTIEEEDKNAKIYNNTNL